MRSYLPILFSSGITAILTFMARGVLRTANRRIWQNKALDLGAKYLPYLVLGCFILVAISMRLGLKSLLPLLLVVLTFFLLCSLIFIVSLPLSIFMDWLSQRPKISATETDKASRRRFLKTSAAILPSLLLTSTAAGFAGGYQSVRIRRIEMEFDNLPVALEGFSILHLSDLHLGYYFQLSDLEELLTRLESQSIDMLLVTGDLSDDLQRLPDALNLIGQFPSAYPRFISIGNHEYYRGVKTFFKEVNRANFPLLLNYGVTVDIKGVPVYFAGADDPVRLNADIKQFMKASTERAMQEAPADAFKILMSHRPLALDFGAQNDIDLILAGHTHGGQIGFNGRSVFENTLKNERYLWGKYQRQKTRMYTSSGVGHWLPFRIGCPPEAPIIVLKKKLIIPA